MDNQLGFIFKKNLSYKKEYIFKKNNPVYRAVEKLMLSLGMDTKNAGKKNWNPLGKLIKPGQKVVIKPNLVASRDREQKLRGKVLLASSTNPAVIRPLVDYAWKALKGKGTIRIIDAPLEGSNFKQLAKNIGLVTMVDYLKKEGVNLKLLDLRDFKLGRLMLLDNLVLGNYSFNLGFVFKKKLPGDPRGYRVINLKTQSFFSQKDRDFRRLAFHRSNRYGPWPHHQDNKNEYSIAKTVLEADVFINIPKLKTHKKAGVTLNLKNIVGTTNRKYWLPHYRVGSPPQGDEYPARPDFLSWFFFKISRLPLSGNTSLIINIVKVKNRKPLITEGGWHGNDTVWRTILDLNKAIFFTDQKGKPCLKSQKKCFCLIDGIIAGEGTGPISPTPKNCGLLIGGFNPWLVDLLAVKLMGFDHRKIKQISEGGALFGQTQKQMEKTLKIARQNFQFEPPFGWDNLKF